MNECYIDGVLMRYVSSSTRKFVLGMAYNGRTDTVASLKSHVFSCNANSSTSQTSIHQVNCIGTPIYSSQNEVAPPSSEQSNTDLASIKISTATLDNFTSKSRREETSKVQAKRTNTPELNDLNTTSLGLNDVSKQNGGLNLHLHERIPASSFLLKQNSGLNQKSTPIVIITPASAVDSDSGEMEDTNGELDAANLSDCIDSCSLSSACSEDDIPTDDDPSESDSAPQPEEPTRKVKLRLFSCYCDLFALHGFQDGRCLLCLGWRWFFWWL